MRSYAAQNTRVPTASTLANAAPPRLTPVLADRSLVEEPDEAPEQRRDVTMSASLMRRALHLPRPKACVNTGYADLVVAARDHGASSSPEVSASNGVAGQLGSGSSLGNNRQTLARFAQSAFRTEPAQSLQFNLATELVRERDDADDRHESAVQLKCDTCLASDPPRAPDDEKDRLQRKDSREGASRVPTGPREMRAIADAGLDGASEPLPHLDRIGPLLAPHDLSRVRTRTGGAAAEANVRLGSLGYTMGERIAFRFAPDVKLAAHEAAHVVQQRNGVNIPNGIGCCGDACEKSADEVAVAASGPCNPIPKSNSSGVRSSAPEQASIQRQEATDSAATPQKFVRQQVLSAMIDTWRSAGLLDPPFRPPGVAEFPPLGARAGKLEYGTPESSGGTAAAMGAASPAVPLPEGAPPQQPPLRLIPGGGVSPEPVPAPVPLPPPLLVGILAALVVLLWPSSTAPAWLDEINPVTGGPYGSPEEYEWVKRLSGPQLEYLLFLRDAQKMLPDPAADGEGNPYRVPVPAPAPDTASPQQCFATQVPRRGGHAGHDTYATRVTGSPYDYYVRTPVGLAINYDGLTNPRVVWEVKVGYGWFFNPATTALTAMTLARWDAQKDLGVTVATICGYMHLWAHRSHHIVNLLNSRWGGIPPVLHIP